MQSHRTQRRRHGTGSLIERNGTYYGQWRADGRLVKRKLGPIRTPGTRDGLTRTQAEAALRKAIEATRPAPVVAERLTVGEVGARLIAHLESMGRKRSTTMAYESMLRVHLVPHFGDQPLDRIDRRAVERLVEKLVASGQAPKQTCNVLGLLHGVFDFAQRRDWASSNPCKLVDKPQPRSEDADVRFLDTEEVEALLGGVPDDDLGRVERVMYLAAVMTGMRQGELLALRWLDVDWLAHRMRVRRNFVRGEYGTPKSKRSSRAVPLADRLARELDALHRESSWQADDDLVFAHPHTGKPIDRSKLLKRFKAALRRAGVREVRFHDLRHTFGTRMAAAGIPMRTLQEWMGYRDFKTTLIYADYAPGEHEAELLERAFAPSPVRTAPGLIVHG
jgi:integrase